MEKLNIPVGISDFREIRENGYYYIDKTFLIYELLKTPATKVTLITRPRRFGKTLGMSMLADFFDIRKESSSLFEGLDISEKTNICNEWLNQYPVIFLSLKDIDGLTFKDAYGQLVAQIADLYKEYTYLLECAEIDEDDKKIFLDLKAGKADKVQVSRSFSTLMKMLQIYYQKPVILLLDEYDVPVAKASNHGYYNEMLDVMKGIMSTALKDNQALRFAVITGCLKIAKESIFTGTNNFVSDTIRDSRYNEYFGFTQAEVDIILKDADCTEHAENVREWYDGYHFGEVDVYCPWDVMNYIRDLQHDIMAKPESYWKNTSDNAIIRSFIDYAGTNITKKMEALLAGDYILQTIDENLTYDYLHSSEENLWSILYLTGYLTRARESELHVQIPEGTVALQIPNTEIKEIFETTVIKWFSDNAKNWNRNALFQAVWNSDVESLTVEMNTLLRKTISYHDYKEDFYHAFLAGIFTGAGYAVESNKEHGEGRSDIVVYDSVNGQVAVFEAKTSKTMEAMSRDCEDAIRQIDDRMYAKEYEDEYDHILCYGISFFKKRCLVKKK
ncbi:AAA family ATPase [Dorea formicigenerans]|uniref:AAA family ATPase n=1 Tax=Dorea formicigenerans TaxID=39486 RepID=UPI00156F2DD5|nr:AAA family ATPase [Dorea formicigenerans]NSK19275.1 AAA family ATPase [Dorea formicigenerans]